jgi:hypothetical protein
MADGDFTPSRSYGVIFDTLVLPDGKRRQIGTDVSPGISDVIHLVSGAEREKKKGVASKAAARAKKKVSEAMRTARTSIKSLDDLRGSSDTSHHSFRFAGNFWGRGRSSMRR